jgi:hypothetical protein
MPTRVVAIRRAFPARRAFDVEDLEKAVRRDGLASHSEEECLRSEV